MDPAAAVLAGQLRFDDADRSVQASVLAAWDEWIRDVAGRVDMAAALSATGGGWVELDQDGQVVQRTAS